MRENLTRLRKPERPIAVAIKQAQWPAWVPRPASPQPAPQAAPEEANETEDQSADPRHEQIAMIRLIGKRLREAREMAGFSQLDAAIHLGYKNSSKLAKVENASDTFSVPVALVIKAAGLYEVSADYLLGISEDWDVAPDERHQRQIGRWLFNTWESARERDLAAMAELSKKVSFVASSISALVEKSESVQHAFDRLRDLNAGFDELIAGAKLASSVDVLVDAGRQARLQLLRLHLDLAGNPTEAHS